MKKILLTVLLFVFVGLSAQNLSLNELISLRKMNLDDAETFLTSKGWRYTDGTVPEDGKMGVVNFIYSSRGELKYGESYLALYYSRNGSPRLNIQLHNQAKYLEYLAGVKKFAPLPTNTKIKENKLVKTYVGSTTTFEFTTKTGSNRLGQSTSVWLLFIAENSDFENQFGYY